MRRIFEEWYITVMDALSLVAMLSISIIALIVAIDLIYKLFSGIPICGILK